MYNINRHDINATEASASAVYKQAELPGFPLGS